MRNWSHIASQVLGIERKWLSGSSSRGFKSWLIQRGELGSSPSQQQASGGWNELALSLQVVRGVRCPRPTRVTRGSSPTISSPSKADLSQLAQAQSCCHLKSCFMRISTHKPGEEEHRLKTLVHLGLCRVCVFMTSSFQQQRAGQLCSSPVSSADALV